MPWPKGRPRSEATKRKISLGNRGRRRSQEFVEFCQQRTRTSEHRERFAREVLPRALTPTARTKAIDTLHEPDRLARFVAATKRVHTGRKRSELTRQRLREARRRNFNRHSEAKRRWWAAKTPEEKATILRPAFITRPTSIELAVKSLLEALGIEFEFQRLLGTFTVDFFIPGRNLVIECDGEYWHGTSEAVARDAARDSWLRDQGYRVVRLLEREIRAKDFKKLWRDF